MSRLVTDSPSGFNEKYEILAVRETVIYRKRNLQN